MEQLKQITLRNDLKFPHFATRDGKIYKYKKGNYILVSQHLSNYGYYQINVRLTDGKDTTLKVSRSVLYTFNPIDDPENWDCDHRDRDPTNNSIANLRWATRRQNTTNTVREYTSSSYSGVCWNKRGNKWIAQIRINGKNKYIGRFTQETDAIICHYTCAKEHDLLEWYPQHNLAIVNAIMNERMVSEIIGEIVNNI